MDEENFTGLEHALHEDLRHFSLKNEVRKSKTGNKQ